MSNRRPHYILLVGSSEFKVHTPRISNNQQDNLIFGSSSTIFFIPLTPDPQRPGEELWDIIDRTIPIRIPIPSDVYNVFILDKSKRRYGATSTSGYFYTFTIPNELRQIY